MADEDVAIRPELPGFQLRCKDFMLGSKSFTQQFSHVYYARLDNLKCRLEPLAEARWPQTPRKRLLEVGADRCQIICTLYKQMGAKPDFLKEYTAIEDGELIAEVPANCTSPDDTMIAEDESGRVDVASGLPTGKLCSGLVVAMLGRMNESGKFEVDDFMFPGMATQVPVAPISPDLGPRYIAVVSGLGFGDGRPSVGYAQRAVAAFLRGEFPGVSDLATRQISRLLVAGNLIAQTGDIMLKEKIKLETADLKCFSDAPLVQPMRLADQWLHDVAQAIPVDVMPGVLDPTNVFIPHQPLHPCLLPRAAEVGAAPVTSPHRFVVNESIEVVCTCGDTIDDLARMTTLSHMDAQRLCCDAAHLAPTAPDTLRCYPFTDKDPLVLDSAPHVFIAGNQPSFGTELHKDKNGSACRLVSVPCFVQQPGLTLIDFASPTLDVHFKPFRVPSDP